MDSFKLSIVVPVYNEAENISSLIKELEKVLSSYNDYEIIFVDDGSSDDTLNILRQARGKHQRLFYISFSRNFGHQNALRAGLDKSTGDVIITMDGDHQHPPQLIKSMVDKWQEGHEIVFTTRDDSQNVSYLKKISAAVFYNIINRISDIDIKRGSADFRLFDRKVVEALKDFSEGQIFYRGVIAWLGFSQCEVSYIPEKRFQGQSKYSFKKMVNFALDGISSFSLFPLRLATITGVIIAISSFLYVIYAIYVKFFTTEAVSGWVSIMAGIYFLGGIQLLFLGVCGEYIGRIFMEVKKRPNYVVSEAELP